MVDDLLDFTAEEKTLGKPVANDLREGKVTLPMIFLLRRAVRRGRREGPRGPRGPRLRPREPGGDRASRRGSTAPSTKRAAWPSSTPRRLARTSVAFEPSPYRDALEALPGFILARDH